MADIVAYSKDKLETIPTDSSSRVAILNYPKITIGYAPVVSAKGYFTSVVRYVVHVSAYIIPAEGSGLADAIEQVRDILSFTGGYLAVSSGNYEKIFSPLECSNLGPHPSGLEIIEMPGGRIARATCQFTFEIPADKFTSEGEDVAQDWWTEFAYSIETRVDTDLLVTRMISGVLRINPRSARMKQNRPFSSADACRAIVEKRICKCPDPATWEREWTFRLSEDELELRFVCIDRQRRMALPSDVTSGDFSIAFSLNARQWLAGITLNATFAGSGARRAFHDLVKKFGQALVALTTYSRPESFVAGGSGVCFVEFKNTDWVLSEASQRISGHATWKLQFYFENAKPDEPGKNPQSSMQTDFTAYMYMLLTASKSLNDEASLFFVHRFIQYRQDRKANPLGEYKSGDKALTGTDGIAGRCGIEKLVKDLTLRLPEAPEPETPKPGSPPDSDPTKSDKPLTRKKKPNLYLMWHQHFAYKVDWGYKFVPTIGGTDVMQQWHKPTVWLVVVGEMTTADPLLSPPEPPYRDDADTDTYVTNAEFALNEPTSDKHWNSSWRYILKIAYDELPEEWKVLWPPTPRLEFKDPQPTVKLPSTEIQT